MVTTILRLLFGSKHERDIKKLRPIVDTINSYESEIAALSDEELKARGKNLRQRVENGESLDSVLPECFAVIRETSKRTLGMRHFDVQLMGGIVLHQGKIAEMKTGEGKTLTATLAVALNAFKGRGVHVVTVNDYLARRDAEWMGPIYRFHDLSVGVITSQMSHLERQRAYACDITYGTNNEFGFDYLRDNMVEHRSFRVQRGHYYAIVDEVDSILIDEARTPLIISGPADLDTEGYIRVNRIIPHLQDKVDFEIDEKARTVLLTEMGVSKVEKLLGIENLYAAQNIELVHHVHQCLRAHHLFHRDVDYVVQNGEVIIVDEFTGRLMYGRRYSDGLHQAIEAKEKVPVKQENQTLATITFQNYFRMYEKLAGMTGTADTEAEEFRKIYKLDVVVLPTHKPMIRVDYPDRVYRTQREKFQAIVEEVKECYLRGQPVLLGTVSIENSEKLSKLLQQKGIPHAVLNAKYHEKEAEIIKEAGQKGRVTIATNMAGRGTDIVLGPGVKELGGLHVIGSERHESRRIDNQLRGRSGRQGDPGSSRFYLSLEDELMRIFGSDRLGPIMEKIGMREGDSIEHRMVTKAIERAQKRVEAHNFEIRKHLLEYDDVMNTQRNYIYGIRNEILDKDDITPLVEEYIHDALLAKLEQFLPGKSPASWNLEELEHYLHNSLGISIKKEDLERKSYTEIYKFLTEEVLSFYRQKAKKYGEANMRALERLISLQVIDHKWKEHLYAIDQLREGMWAVGYAERNPLVEYRLRAFELFEAMVQSIKEEIMEFLLKAEIVEPVAIEAPAEYHEVGQAIHSSLKSFDLTSAEELMERTVKEALKKPVDQQKKAKSTPGGASQRRSSRRKRA
ncbi:MAG: preprotein translocase subunit SecA [Leptospiraceae bacterium]|nr:preprotein translocase subunit SecA [Leptospiraceae bacterium]MDW8307494.1 preprotein translocase subunit SecA [Leptospiraceae bacterium]